MWVVALKRLRNNGPRYFDKINAEKQNAAVDNANIEMSEQQTECFRRIETEYPESGT
jgi:hypothetical protein